MFALEAVSLELVVCVNDRLCGREQRIVVPPELVLPQVRNPVGKNLVNIHSHREEVSGECLTELGVHLAGVLVDATSQKVDVLQLQ